MPLRVARPSSPVVAEWRASRWVRIFFLLGGVVMIVAGAWPDGEVLAGIAIAALGVALIWIAPRPLLVLHEDAVYVRGHVLSSVIPIEEISTVAPTREGLTIDWGDLRSSTAPLIGEQGMTRWMPGSDRRVDSITDAILATRDAYLRAHGLTARPTPAELDARERAELERRGWSPGVPERVARQERYREVR